MMKSNSSAKILQTRAMKVYFLIAECRYIFCKDKLQFGRNFEFSRIDKKELFKISIKPNNKEYKKSTENEAIFVHSELTLSRCFSKNIGTYL